MVAHITNQTKCIWLVTGRYCCKICKIWWIDWLPEETGLAHKRNSDCLFDCFSFLSLLDLYRRTWWKSTTRAQRWSAPARSPASLGPHFTRACSHLAITRYRYTFNRRDRSGSAFGIRIRSPGTLNKPVAKMLFLKNFHTFAHVKNTNFLTVV